MVRNWLWRATVMLAVALGVSLGAAAVPAYADPQPVATVGSATNPLSDPGVENSPGRNDCSALSPGGVRVQTNGPALRDGQVLSNADIYTTNLFCGTGRVQISLQTKACGMWGCNWEDRATSRVMYLPANGVLHTDHVVMSLRKGWNRYRLQVNLTFPEIDIEDDFPYITTQEETIYSPEPEYGA